MVSRAWLFPVNRRRKWPNCSRRRDISSTSSFKKRRRNLNTRYPQFLCRVGIAHQFPLLPTLQGEGIAFSARSQAAACQHHCFAKLLLGHASIGGRAAVIAAFNGGQCPPYI